MTGSSRERLIALGKQESEVFPDNWNVYDVILNEETQKQHTSTVQTPPLMSRVKGTVHHMLLPSNQTAIEKVTDPPGDQHREENFGNFPNIEGETDEANDRNHVEQGDNDDSRIHGDHDTVDPEGRL